MIIRLGGIPDLDALPDEEASVVRLGMRYAAVPVDASVPDEIAFTAFCAAMEASHDAPVHIHGPMRDVAAFLRRYRGDLRGIDIDPADGAYDVGLAADSSC